MDPVVAAAIVTAAGGFATALIVRRSTQKIDGVKTQLDAWPALYQAVVSELERERNTRRLEVAEERSIAAGFAQRAERLETERDGALDALRQCREALAGNQEEGLDDPSDQMGA